MNERPHSPFAPSKAYRWLRCALSVKLEAMFIQPPSTAAQEGTKAHEEVARHLLEGTMPENPDLVLYVKTVRSYRGALLVEQAVDIVPEHDVWGTVDAAVFGVDNAVVDFKFGKAPVQVAGNPQLMLYALGLESTYKTRRPWELCVVQPRASSGIPVKRWTVDPKTLRDFRDKVLRAIDRANKPTPLAMPGDHCYYCTAKLFCDEYKLWIVK